jgi:hypothetical protein
VPEAAASAGLHWRLAGGLMKQVADVVARREGFLVGARHGLTLTGRLSRHRSVSQATRAADAPATTRLPRPATGPRQRLWPDCAAAAAILIEEGA